MKHSFLKVGACVLLSIVTNAASATEVPEAASKIVLPQPTQTQTQATPVVEDTPEQRAAKEKMIEISNLITAKISQIQAKQKELDDEIYPASKPPLQTDLDNLNKELADLKLKKEQLEMVKTSNELGKQLLEDKPKAP